jgi:phage shock protein E
MKKMLLILSVIALSSLQAQAKDIVFKGTRMDATIIDVRTAQEFSGGHIEGAINIPYDQIDVGIRSIKGLTKEAPILLYCRSGRRSAIARESLEKLGFRRVLDGGGMETLISNLKSCSTKQC